MSRVIFFHYDERFPKLSPEEMRGLRDKLLDELKNYPPGIGVDTYLDVEGTGLGVCEWEVPDEVENPAKIVREIVTKLVGKPPAEKIVEVKKVI